MRVRYENGKYIVEDRWVFDTFLEMMDFVTR